MVLLRCAIRRLSSNVGGPWWGVVIETVSENHLDLEDLFERVEGFVARFFEERLTDVRIRR